MITLTIVGPWSIAEEDEGEGTQDRFTLKFKDPKVLSDLLDKHIPTLPGIRVLIVPPHATENLELVAADFFSFAAAKTRVLTVWRANKSQQMDMLTV